MKKDLDIFIKSNLIIKRISLENKSIFFKNLETLLSSGIPIIKALDILNNQGIEMKFTSMIKDELLKGNSLRESMNKVGYFDELSLTLIEVGEKTGKLDESLNRLSSYFEHLDLTYKEVKSATYYPIFILCMIFFLFIFIIYYFLPNILSLYGEQLPQVGGWTQFIIEFSIFLKEYMLVIIISFILLIYLTIEIVSLFKKPIRSNVLKYRIPIIGDLIFKQKLNNIVWALQIMLCSGVSILNALNIIETMNNEKVIKVILKNIQEFIIKGNSLTESIKLAGINEKNLLYFISIGEETGDLENKLSNLNNLYTQYIKRRSKILANLSQPIFISIITVVIGITMLTVVMPLLDYDLLYNL